ncbi:hypothetical protein RclHR1_05670007 [Rhizophagus clarus]|uniref:Uncharacterized protein n=1 Tax=Rhizophagus clarus TaxID=94130 RepID=A0A2Z6S0Y0_9GLOM|nr:hypothetical protein RclHR1_05670007 [Rhizophagus clarus]GES82042.1 hypothetical protein GLOIN_2v1867852 [Rhizophagus clarus]
MGNYCYMKRLNTQAAGGAAPPAEGAAPEGAIPTPAGGAAPPAEGAAPEGAIPTPAGGAAPPAGTPKAVTPTPAGGATPAPPVGGATTSPVLSPSTPLPTASPVNSTSASEGANDMITASITGGIIKSSKAIATPGLYNDEYNDNISNPEITSNELYNNKSLSSTPMEIVVSNQGQELASNNNNQQGTT